MLYPNSDSIYTIKVITGTSETIIKKVKEEGANFEFPPKVNKSFTAKYMVEVLTLLISDLIFIFSKNRMNY